MTLGAPTTLLVVGLAPFERLATPRRGWQPGRRQLGAVLAGLVAVLISTLGLALPDAVTTGHYAYDRRANTGLDPEAPIDSVVSARIAGSAHGYDPHLNPERTNTRPVPEFFAPQTADDLVDLTTSARGTHILDGEVRPNGTYGGGHRPGTGFPGKSEFPAGWSDGRILHEISDVATDPASRIVRQQGRDVFVRGSRNGVEIEVLLRNGEIWTGYPTNLPRNP